MIHEVCLDLLGRLIKTEGECCALEEFSRLRELLLLLCPIFLFLLLYFCLVPVLFLSGPNLGLWWVLAGPWATWACFFTALSFLGDTASVLSSAVSLLYFGLCSAPQCDGPWNVSTWQMPPTCLLGTSQWIYFFITVNRRSGTISWVFCQVILGSCRRHKIGLLIISRSWR